MVKGDVSTHVALEKIWSYITQVDQFIDMQAPWKLAKEKKTDELSGVLTVLVEAVRQICVLTLPFIPAATEKIWKAYGFEKIKGLGQVRFNDLTALPFIKSDHQLTEQKLNLFPRIQVAKAS